MRNLFDIDSFHNEFSVLKSPSSVVKPDVCPLLSPAKNTTDSISYDSSDASIAEENKVNLSKVPSLKALPPNWNVCMPKKNNKSRNQPPPKFGTQGLFSSS